MPGSGLAEEVRRISGQNIEQCYHCHKCTAGCPVIEGMSFGPDRMLRMVALDDREVLLQSQDIWLCSGCYTCITHCPNEIDVSRVMDALRQIAIAEGSAIGEHDALLFHKLFMGVVQQLGRSHEAATLGLFKVRSHTPLIQDMGAGLNLFMRGKVPILPKYSRKTAAQVHQMFQKSKLEDK